jgi:molybdopterin-guanine dinucleotide biosynthesis protein MobB
MSGSGVSRLVIGVVGEKKSGKTTTVEALIRELSIRGLKIAAVKHASEQKLEMDTKGKDTWRYARAGASVVVGVAGQEIVTVEKVCTERCSIREILKKTGNCDIIILEGFKELISKRKDIAKIVAVKSMDEALRALETFEPVLAFTGPVSPEKLSLNIPYVDVMKNPEKLAELAEKEIVQEKRKHLA